jgi:hypothetical protein
MNKDVSEIKKKYFKNSESSHINKEIKPKNITKPSITKVGIKSNEIIIGNL